MKYGAFLGSSLCSVVWVVFSLTVDVTWLKVIWLLHKHCTGGVCIFTIKHEIQCITRCYM